MKIQVLQENLAKAISTCSRFASSRVQLPVLANILLKITKSKFSVAATNLEMSISISIGAKIEKEGQITVPARVLNDLISNLSAGTVDLEVEKENLKIKSLSFESSLSGMNASDFPLIPEEVGVDVLKIPSKEIEIDTPRGTYKIALPGIFFDEIDFSISCPVPKVHCMTTITLSYKNQWGCLPDVMRLKNHYMFDYIISKVSDILKFKYAFLDGRYGLTNNGPMVGDPIEVNWFAASNSLGAFDMIVSEMMGFNWEGIGHLKMAAKYGFIPNRENIQVIGDIESLKRKFVLKRNIWNYPALTAFHSPKLTHLFYFSIWAKLLHDVMYTFRKRPIIEQ